MSDLAPIMEAGNPSHNSGWAYAASLIMIPLMSIVGVIVLLVLRPSGDNSALVTQILGFGATITMATLAYLKASDTREIVNSRMDEFKRTIQMSADAAVAHALMQGKAEGRAASEQRTDALQTKADHRTDDLAAKADARP